MKYTFTIILAIFHITSYGQLAAELGILDLTANGGINPATGVAWASGDKYRFAFISSGSRNGTSTNINDYNTFIQGLANSSSLNIGATQGITWKCIGSSISVDARDNISNGNGDGEAIFLLDGETIVASDSADMWNGLTNPIDMDEEANGSITGDANTGSNNDGTKRGRSFGNTAEAPPKITMFFMINLPS